jgi:nicotinamide-nucleotide amidase
VSEEDDAQRRRKKTTLKATQILAEPDFNSPLSLSKIGFVVPVDDFPPLAPSCEDIALRGGTQLQLSAWHGAKTDDIGIRMVDFPAPFSAEVQLLAEQIGQQLLARGETLATAESCTGGLIAAAITEVAGSSAWFERGFITYANHAKTEMLDVPAAFIDGLGAVSEPVVAAMAQGAAQHANARWAVAVSGIAGPTGGSADKPVGTVWIAWATPNGIVTERQVFAGNRSQVRAATVYHALQHLLTLMKAA